MNKFYLRFNPLEWSNYILNKHRSWRTMEEQLVDGVPHVLVPKDAWEKIWDVFERIEKMGE